MRDVNQRGIGTVEALLLLVIAAMIVFTGYFVWNSQSEADDVYEDTTKVQEAPNLPETESTQQDYDNCTKAPGSRILETYPEQCVTQDGKTYVTSATVSPPITRPGPN